MIIMHARVNDYSPTATPDFITKLESALNAIDINSDAASFSPDAFELATILLASLQVLLESSSPVFSIVQLILQASNVLITAVTNNAASTAKASVEDIIAIGVNKGFFNKVPLIESPSGQGGLVVDENAPPIEEVSQLQSDAIQAGSASAHSRYVDYSDLAPQDFKNKLEAALRSKDQSLDAQTYTPYASSFVVAVLSALELGLSGTARPYLNFAQVITAACAKTVKTVTAKTATLAFNSATKIIETGVSRHFFSTPPRPFAAPVLGGLELDEAKEPTVSQPSRAGMFAKAVEGYRNLAVNAVKSRILGY